MLLQETKSNYCPSPITLPHINILWVYDDCFAFAMASTWGRVGRKKQNEKRETAAKSMTDEYGIMISLRAEK